MRLSSQFVTFDSARKLASSTPEVGAAEARRQLVEMATSLVHQGSPKSGFLRLRLHQQAGNTDLGHGRMGTGYTAASRLVSDLVRKAYGENSEAALKFGEYLDKRGKVGVKSFLQLVKTMEGQNLPPQSELQRLNLQQLGGRLRLLLPSQAKTVQPRTHESAQVPAQAQGEAAAAGVAANPLERGSWTVLGRHYLLDMASKRSGADGHVVMGFNLEDPADQVCLKIDKPVSKPGQEPGTAVENRIFNRLQAAGPAHPNIVKRLDYQPSSNVLVLEKCKGSLLQETTGPLQMPQMGQRVAWFSQTRLAMEHLHSQGIVHRDLNTKNVLVREDGTAAMTDFGNAYDFQHANSQICMDDFGNAQNLEMASSAERRDLITLGYNLLAGGDKAPPPSVTPDSAMALLAGLPANEVQRLTPLLQQAFKTYHAEPAASPEATRQAVAALGEVFQRLEQLAAQPAVAARAVVSPAIAAHRPHADGTELNLGVANLRDLPAAINLTLTQSKGALTPELMNWLIQSGQVVPALDPLDQIELQSLPRSGASNINLMMVRVNGHNAFVIKECGTLAEMPVGRNDRMELSYFNYYQEPGNAIWQSNNFEDLKLQRVQDSALGRMGTLEAPNGARFGLAHTEATLRFKPPPVGTVVTETQDYSNSQVMHQLNVLRVAPGQGMAGVLEGGDLAQAEQAAKDMGSALGAFHRAHLQGGPIEPTGGLRTLIHGDFHPGNLFYEPSSRILTFIDLARAAANFLDQVDSGQQQARGVPSAFSYQERQRPGHDMLMDVRRAVEQGEHFRSGPPQLKQAFLQAYAENFKDVLNAQGQPRYSAQSLDELIQQPILGAALN